MGLRFRKSINLGLGFRVNISKSGVGYSWGVPGYRKTIRADGRKTTTYSIPGTGISYSESSKTNKKNIVTHEKTKIYTQTFQEMQDIESSDISSFQSAEYKDFINKLSKMILFDKMSTVFIILGIGCVVNPVFIVLLCIGIILKFLLIYISSNNLTYEMDDYSSDNYNLILNKFTSLNKCKGFWQIIKQKFNSNIKVNAGVSRQISRISVKFSKKVPYYLRSNINIIFIKLKKETIYFLPDKLLIVKGHKIGVLDYDDLKIKTEYTIFVEGDHVPKDATKIGTTWRYVNKNGTPDKRFKNNKQLPKCKYGKILLTSDNGLNIELQCSNLEIFNDFAQNI